VEYNLFERTEADSESIFIKSSANIVRYNTWKNSDANVTIRGGSNNHLIGNTITNMKALVVYGKDNEIIGNGLKNTHLIIRNADITYGQSIKGKHGWAAAENTLVAGNKVSGGIIGVGTRKTSGSKTSGIAARRQKAAA
jgi:hypothetical protein